MIGRNYQKSFGARDDGWREADELRVIKHRKARQPPAEPRAYRVQRGRQAVGRERDIFRTRMLVEPNGVGARATLPRRPITGRPRSPKGVHEEGLDPNTLRRRNLDPAI
jgi:hypothetical protein